MIFGALARTVLTLLIAFAAWFPAFAMLVFFKGIANLLYWPASSILTNQVVRDEQRVKYFSSLSLMDQITKIGTPLLAGALTFIVSSQLLFLVSAGATLVCAVMLQRLNVAVALTPPLEKRSVAGLFSDLFQGLRAIGSLPPMLLLSIALGVGMSLALAIYDPHLAAFIDSKGFDASVFSIAIAATGVGAVVGAASIRFAFSDARPMTLIWVGVAVFTVAIGSTAIVVALAPELLGRSTLASAWFLNGLGYTVFTVGCSVNMQNLCPSTLLGRVNTSARSLQMTAVVLGPSVGAWLINTYSRSMPFMVSAAITLFLSVIVIIFGVLRKKAVLLGRSEP
jgi:MFS family permease